jgi:transcriptional regulator with XRE-family HTH domain
LKEEKLDSANILAIKRVIAYQIAEEMKKKKLSKTEMASRMKTSRAALERLLDPENALITLITLERAASAVGKKLKVQLA